MTGPQATALASVSVAAVVFLLAGARGERRRRARDRLLVTVRRTSAPAVDRRRVLVLARRRPEVIVPGLVAIAVLVASAAGGAAGRPGGSVATAAGVIAAAVFSGTAMLVVRLVRARRRRRRAESARHRLVVALGILSAELRAGRMSREALATAAAEYPPLLAIAEENAASYPGGAPASITDVDDPGLAGLTVAWRVAEQSGAALGVVVDRLTGAVRAGDQVRRQVSAGLAGTRTTARLLALLPLAPLSLGQLLGQHPIRFLLGSPVGFACLAVGAALAALGLVWVERMAARCERP